MKRAVVLLVFGVFLMMVMVGGVSAGEIIKYRSQTYGCIVNFTQNKVFLDINLDKSYIYNIDKDGGSNIKRFNESDNIKIILYSDDYLFYSGARGKNNQSVIEGIFIFKNSGIKGFLNGAIKRIGPEVLIAEGVMVGEDLSNPLSKPYYSIFYLRFGDNIMQEGCMFETKGAENINMDNDYYYSKIFSLEENQSLQNQRISILESWKKTIDTWKTTLTSTITSILNTLTNHTTKINNQETRISKLENQTSSTPNYFKYLGSSDRKAIVCGYAQDNHLTQINDLGFNCTIKYTPLRNGGEKAYCKCVGK